MSNLVIVESPAKAKTINKYLGKDFSVTASYGHIRDLPSKKGSVNPEEDFSMIWELNSDSKKRLTDIKKQLKSVDTLYLATDPDREGEAISWHLYHVLEDAKALKNVDVKRITFNEITKRAVQEAISSPRNLNQELIDAYLARRALDYLVGFTLSPLLWKRLPGSKSAGRVQSVALRLICERELEIEQFQSQEYWTILGNFISQDDKKFQAKLSILNGNKLEKFSFKNADEAKAAKDELEKHQYKIAKIDKKVVQRKPQPPFTTSTLQQEASRKLGFGASRTMRTAQQLYEGVQIGSETTGLITYMRTDSVTMSNDAIQESRSVIGKRYGQNYLPAQARQYKSKAKNAQEAHECIRPTNIALDPKSVANALSTDQAKLYELVWKRAVASQMSNAEFDQVTAILTSENDLHHFRATGSTQKFDGFLTLYQEGQDEKAKDAFADGDDDKKLPPLSQGEMTPLKGIETNQHFTEPPPRYSEASLVKKLEELGIGRPSTYATIISVLQAREYVVLEKKRFLPQEKGFLVTAFLKQFFQKYVEYDFTASLENLLDDISNAKEEWKKVLQDFWVPFSTKASETEKLPPETTLKAIENELHDHFFPEGKSQEKCPKCDDGEIHLKISKFGAFLGCSNYPDCKHTQKISDSDDDNDGQSDIIELGEALGGMVSKRKGPYGPYIQLDIEGEEKPKRTAIPKSFSPEDVDLGKAISLLSLPRDIGEHPETSKMIQAGIGRYGPFIKHEKTFVSIPAEDDVLTIGINRAIDLLSTKKGAPAGRELGAHPDDGETITVHDGRYGPYVKYKKLNVTIPKNMDPQALTVDQAVELIVAKQKQKKKK